MISAKKILTITTLVGTVLSTSTPILAIDATSSTRPLLKKEKVEERIEAKKGKVETRIQNVREKMASREAVLKAKLQGFKDQKKALLAEKVNTNLNKINENQTTQMLRSLGLMTTLLNKLENRVTQSSSDIKDPASVKIAISSARNTIATTSALIKEQAEKDYTIEVTTESRVKKDAGTVRKSLHTDLMSSRKAVIDAKRAVSNTFRIAAGQRQAKEATSSGQ